MCIFTLEINTMFRVEDPLTSGQIKVPVQANNEVKNRRISSRVGRK